MTRWGGEDYKNKEKKKKKTTTTTTAMMRSSSSSSSPSTRSSQPGPWGSAMVTSASCLIYPSIPSLRNGNFCLHVPLCPGRREDCKSTTPRTEICRYAACTLFVPVRCCWVGWIFSMGDQMLR